MQNNYFNSELCEQWLNENHTKVIQKHNIKSLQGIGGIRLSVKEQLRKGTNFVPVITESGDLGFAYGWPQIRVKKVQSLLEARQYRVIATTDTGEEHYSDWYDSEFDATDLMNQVDKEDNAYIGSEIQKRIKELEADESEENLTPINTKLKKTPPAKPTEDDDKVEESLEEKKLKKDDDDPCWDGYVKLGTKKKNGKEVPNCVPMEDLKKKK
jgi:uncharacterized protein YecA (UPF0149 family)